jgi:hypothetical protein
MYYMSIDSNNPQNNDNNYINDNISYFFKEECDFDEMDCEEVNIINLMNEFDNMQVESKTTNSAVPYNLQEDFLFAEMNNYADNYTVKQLMHICDYYGISKEVKAFKCKKQEIVNFLLVFENTDNNFEVVMKRKQLWYYINELKNDKFMKKFILWE